MTRRSSRATGWQTPNSCIHQLLAVVEPFTLKLFDRVRSKLVEEFEQPAFTNTRSTKDRRKVTVPVLWNPDSQLAHPNDIINILVIVLDFNRGKEERSLLIYVSCQRHKSGRCRIAGIRDMSLRKHSEAMYALLIKNGHEYGPIRGVGVTVIGRIVEKRVAFSEVRMEVFHDLGHDIRTSKNVNRDAFGDREDFVIRGHDAAREVARNIHDRRSSGAKEGIHHGSRNTFETTVQYGEHHRAQVALPVAPLRGRSCDRHL